MTNWARLTLSLYLKPMLPWCERPQITMKNSIRLDKNAINRLKIKEKAENFKNEKISWKRNSYIPDFESVQVSLAWQARPIPQATNYGSIYQCHFNDMKPNYPLFIFEHHFGFIYKWFGFQIAHQIHVFTKHEQI